MTLNEAERIWLAIAAWDPVPMWSEATLGIYARLIDDLDYKATVAATGTWMRTQTRRPKPADIRREVMATGITSLAAAEAWGIVQEDVRELGRHQTPHFRNKALNKTIAQLGWDTFCTCDPRNEQTLYSQFCRAYEANARKATEDLIAHDADGLPLIDQSRATKLIEWFNKAPEGRNGPEGRMANDGRKGGAR
jgi:hypothetical protein